MSETGLFGERAEASGGRPDRKPLVCFVADAETEQSLRAGFGEALPPGAEFRRIDSSQIVAALRAMPTPWTIVLDIAGHPQPLALLDDVSNVVEPNVRVLVIGDRSDVGFYRSLTRGLGVADYLYKPVTPTMVAEHFTPVVAGRGSLGRAAPGGRLVAVTGARGGVGASTIVANLAWLAAQGFQRHSCALDADVYRGTLPLLYSAIASTGLRGALERPERIDDLLIERAAVKVEERLFLLAAEEGLANPLVCAPGSVERLVATLRRRYNFIFADVPFSNETMARDLLDQAQLRVVVMEPTLPGIRDALRLLQLPPGQGQAFRPLLVLNRAGRKGTLPVKQVAETMKVAPDVVIPDLPAKIEEAATLGKPAAAAKGAFRAALDQLALKACGVGKPPARGLFRVFRR